MAIKRKRTKNRLNESFRSAGNIGQRAEKIKPNPKNIQGIVLKPKVGPPVSR